MLRRAVIVLAILASACPVEPATVVGPCRGGERGHLYPTTAPHGKFNIFLVDVDDHEFPICMLKPFMSVEVTKEKDT